MTEIGAKMAMRSPMERHGDEVVKFADFHTTTYESTLRFALRTARGDLHLAEEATQEAYTRMFVRWKERSRFTDRENAQYVLRTTINCVIDFYRKNGRLVELDEETEPHGEDPAIQALLDSSGVLDAVRVVLNNLPPRRAAAAALHFLGDYSYRQIADVLGIAESTARTHIERVRIQLKPYIDEWNRRGEVQ